MEKISKSNYHENQHSTFNKNLCFYPVFNGFRLQIQQTCIKRISIFSESNQICFLNSGKKKEVRHNLKITEVFPMRRVSLQSSNIRWILTKQERKKRNFRFKLFKKKWNSNSTVLQKKNSKRKSRKTRFFYSNLLQISYPSPETFWSFW